MMRHIRFGILAAGALLITSACNPPLDIKNNDAPDVLRALATPNDVKNVAASSLNSWYLASTSYDPYLVFEVASDHMTANYGNFGMRFNNDVPRTPYENSSAGASREATEVPWNSLYGALGAATDAMKAFKAGVKLANDAETDQYKTLAMFAQAASLAELGLIFDQAFIVDENSEGAPALSKYQDVITAAMVKYDAVIAAANGKSFTFSSSVLPLDKVPFSAQNLYRIANTMAARTLVYSARTLAETQALNWTKILAYADKGISGTGLTSFDFTVNGDGGNNWYALNIAVPNSTWGVPVHVKTINMMAPNVPPVFDGTKVAPTVILDKRLGATNRINWNTGDFTAQAGVDFSYENIVVGNPTRGIWKQSPYWYFRYYYYGWDQTPGYEGPAPFTLAAENDLIIAEALVRTNGDLSRAATLINKTRVTRGGLAPVTAGDGATNLLKAIAYEMDIELYSTAANGLYLRRRLDNVQIGTIRHLPIPAKELETLGLPIYTFGGVTQNPGGK